MPEVKLRDEYRHAIDASRTRRFPAGWRGNVSDEVAEAIEADGAGDILDKPVKKAAAKSGGKRGSKKA